ncbi:prolipoprotein diacylglyceryl transferase [Pseudoblastomonas halimionae]|uniref:Phosphatidylglycerol--prolipoprotein diacylglyceryl transferase n=1 Tax=Alteriqipengyuania halimionae TaxID=1926630 RepID=A0A6I4UA61_9SPHN|nr:prolipoprotein diacylglyceryl transferase [Alteriqipengyuania halimionae]MXP11167.1 prolipoprotein diacylglyceryl transferase [Alteriqipengyuania halimionae]
MDLSPVLAAVAGEPLRWTDLGLQEGIHIGSFTLRYYSLAYLLGIIFAYWHTMKAIKTPGAPMAPRHVDDLFFYCTLGVILGGRLGYAIFYQPSLFTTFTPDSWVSWNLLRLWDGGMSFHGGVLGVLVAITWVTRRGGLSFLRVCDFIAVPVPMGMLLGRLANFVNGELWGRVASSDVPWAMVFPGAGPEPRHPSQLYQAAGEGLILLIVMLSLFWLTKARWRPGLLVGVFATGIAISRFVMEFFRQPDAQLTEFAENTGLSMGQWLTIPLFFVGLYFVVRALRKPPLGKSAVTTPA